MRREGINLLSAGCQAEITRPKLLDFKAKRAVNNKITIYSQKYSNLMSTQSLPEDTEYIFTTTSTVKTDSRSVNFHDSRTKNLQNSQRYTQSAKKDQQAHKQLDQRFIIIIRNEIATAKSKYEARTKELLEANAKTICQLRHSLSEQQRRLAQKQQIILGLLNQKMSSYSKLNLGVIEGNKKIKLGQYMYLKDRVEDLETKLKIVLQTLTSGDCETVQRIQQLEQQLIQHYGTKMAQFRTQLQSLATNLTKKLQFIALCLNRRQIAEKQSKNNTLEQNIKDRLQQIKDQIQIFNKTKYKYENPSIFEMQTVLRSLSQKIDKIALHNSRRQQYTFDDDDQFFYPQTDRVYETNDDYEHFQADSDQEREKKKENKPFNGQWSGCKLSI